MSILFIMSALTTVAGITETAESYFNKAKDYASCRMFKRKLRARRNRKIEFI